MNNKSANNEFPLDTHTLTWAALLGKWVAFAKSSLALPATGEGAKLRASVADLITLQAVWFALKDVNDLPRDQQLLGLDRAQVLIEKSEQALATQWGGAEKLPEQITELIQEAKQQYAEAESAIT